MLLFPWQNYAYLLNQTQFQLMQCIKLFLLFKFLVRHEIFSIMINVIPLIYEEY